MDKVTRYSKAITGWLVPILAWVAARYGFELSPDQAAGLAALVTGLAVLLVPNKAPTQPGDIQAYIAELEKQAKATEAPAIHRTGPGE